MIQIKKNKTKTVAPNEEKAGGQREQANTTDSSAKNKPTTEL